MTDDHASEGKRRRQRAQGAHADRIQSRLASLDPGMATWADDFIFGQVWGRPGLSQDERMLVAITALATAGHANMMRNYLHGALQAGIPPRKIHEALVMLTIYAGFPATVGALWEWKQALAVAVKQGVVSPDAAAELDREVPAETNGGARP